MSRETASSAFKSANRTSTVEIVVAVWLFALAATIATILCWPLIPWPDLAREHSVGSFLVQLAAAIGTVGAVVVSLGLALTSNHEAEKRTAGRARIVAARMGMQLMRCYGMMTTASRLLGAAAEREIDTDMFLAICTEIQDILSDRCFEISDETLLALQPIGGQCAECIASVLGSVADTRAEAVRIGTKITKLGDQGTYEQKVQKIKSWKGGIDNHIRLISEAISHTVDAIDLARLLQNIPSKEDK